MYCIRYVCILWMYTCCVFYESDGDSIQKATVGIRHLPPWHGVNCHYFLSIRFILPSSYFIICWCKCGGKCARSCYGGSCENHNITTKYLKRMTLLRHHTSSWPQGPRVWCEMTERGVSVSSFYSTSARDKRRAQRLLAAEAEVARSSTNKVRRWLT